MGTNGAPTAFGALSASEFLDRVALLIPPPRKHWHQLLWGAGAELAVAGAGYGAGWAEAGGGA